MLYDVFICHASEDKDDFVRPLAKKLRKSYLEVWYDEFSLKVGDSLRESIDRGLSKSRFGIVVLSPSFFQKNWPQKELNGLTAREIADGQQIILPIWHKIAAKEIIQYSPTLADKKAIESKKGFTYVCKELLKKIRPEDSPLIIARDMLIEAGLNPPVVTDEWWLDIVEASNRLPSGGFAPPENTCWGRWTFPLPGWGSKGKERGVWLAWTACQMKWEEAAEKLQITQITKPEIVLDFINSYTGLSSICHSYPNYFALYAPQLTIKGLGGEFEKDFDELLKKSIDYQQKLKALNNKSGSALTTNQSTPICEEEIALHHPNFGNYEPSYVACQFVQGDIGSPEVKYYEIFEYLIWFLTKDSSWLPDNVHKFLLQGMKEWVVWLPFSHRRENKYSDMFSNAMVSAKNYKSFKVTSEVEKSLLFHIKYALQRIQSREDPNLIMGRFLKEGIIEAYFEEHRKRKKKHQ
jgi:hypothetical protein